MISINRTKMMAIARSYGVVVWSGSGIVEQLMLTGIPRQYAIWARASSHERWHRLRWLNRYRCEEVHRDMLLTVDQCRQVLALIGNAPLPVKAPTTPTGAGTA